MKIRHSRKPEPLHANFMGHIRKSITVFFKRLKSEKFFLKKYDLQFKHVDYSHLYNPDNFFSEKFFLNLIRTINWTENIVSTIENRSEIDYSTILRLTNPDYKGKPFYHYEGSWSYAVTPEIRFNYLPVIQEAMIKRTNSNFSVKDFIQLGRILEFEIDVTTHDGAPCAESKGLVDESDIPPIDTWFYLTKTKLYCWIPNLFIEKMQGAIDVEILGSYNWIEDSNPSLQLQTVDRLKAAYNTCMLP